MNFRKFYFTATIITALFLFISGVAIIQYINSGQASQVHASGAENPINDIFKPYMLGRTPFNILVLGGDKVNNNSDTMILVNFDPVTCKINAMSIPRDTKARINGKNHKINYAYPKGGIELTAKTVSGLLDVKIRYYIFIDTSAFRKVIDLLGGVEIDVPVDMNYDDPTQNLHIHLKKGLQVLDGDKSEQFVRFRKANRMKEVKGFYDGSDLTRIEAQQYFLTELIRQKLNIQYITRLRSIVNTLFENMETNFTMNEVLKLTSCVSKINSESVKFIEMPGKPQDATPWYFLCDIEDARLVTTENFKCEESFVLPDEESRNIYETNSTDKADKESGSVTGGKNGGKKDKPKLDTTADNPSNDDTSLDEEQTPAP